MLTVLLIAVGWLFGPLLLLIAISWVYRLVERRMGHDPLDDAFGQRQDRDAQILLYPTRTRSVMGTPQRSPRAADTAEGVTAKETRDDLRL